jgi:O-glycosyl hydrolase
MKVLEKVLLVSFFVAGPVLSACSKRTVVPVMENHCYSNGVDTCNITVPSIEINLQKTHQTIVGFGASDGWTTKFIGNWSNTTKKNQIADYLFSNDTDKTGTPQGIALSIWRFYIGAGSFEQGDSSGIPDIFRREECFINADGSFNWNKQSGQQWFLNAAKQRGVNNFIGFAPSPPVQYTINNRAYGLGTSQLNLKIDKYNAYADFLVSVAQHFNSIGYPMKYISPFNEPQWNWGTSRSQEGTGATNTQMAALIKVLGPKIQASGVPVKIAFGEANQWNSLYENNGDDRGDQINQFFNTNSSNYIGNVPALENVISAHSYFTTCPDGDLVTYRQKVFNQINQVSSSTQLWETEFGILGDICGVYNGYPRNLSIDYGLYVAKVIHNDLAIAGVSSWQWWLGVDTYNYSDGLVYINDPSGGYDLNAIQNDGIVTDSKQLWCLGNFSRFIRPGMIRVDAGISTISNPSIAAATQMISAYKDLATKKIVIVVVNEEATAKHLQIDLSALNLTSDILTAYTTSVSKNLKKSVVNSGSFMLDGKSVTTLIGFYK